MFCVYFCVLINKHGMFVMGKLYHACAGHTSITEAETIDCIKDFHWAKMSSASHKQKCWLVQIEINTYAWLVQMNKNISLLSSDSSNVCY